MGGYDAPIVVWQKVKLPFKVELDFCSLDNKGPGFELVAFPHPCKKLKKAGQNLFIFTVELISVVKPRNIKPIKRGEKAFRMVLSPRDDEDDGDDDDADESANSAVDAFGAMVDEAMAEVHQSSS